jgi:hypothetical protein
VIRKGDDPDNLLQKVLNKWRVPSALSAGYITIDDEGHTSNLRCSPSVVQEGDFVDLGVGFDIVRRKKIAVHLSLKHILILRSCADKVSYFKGFNHILTWFRVRTVQTHRRTGL